MTPAVQSGLARAIKRRDRALEQRQGAMKDLAYWLGQGREHGASMEAMAQVTGYTRKQLYNIMEGR